MDINDLREHLEQVHSKRVTASLVRFLMMVDLNGCKSVKASMGCQRYYRYVAALRRGGIILTPPKCVTKNALD